MSDNSFDTGYGPSTPGALNLISGQTHGVYAVNPTTGAKVTDAYTVASPDANGVGTVINDPDPAFDDCSDKNHTSTSALGVMTGRNVGDLLNDRHVTWGWFQGGFKPTGAANGYSVCGALHANIGGNAVVDYSPHHNPFAYYKSTANPKHLPPSSVAAIGHTDQANHNYDLSDFDAAVLADNLPSVSYVKAGEYQDGHGGYSDPLDEQTFLVHTINELQQSKQWASTAVVVAYDDSDGWYDHVFSGVHNPSDTSAVADPPGPQDFLTGVGLCGKSLSGQLAGENGRCGYGPRLPLLVVSPWAKESFVDHTLTDQSSIIRFVEDNWQLPRIAGSYDSIAGPLSHMFDFNSKHGDNSRLFIDPVTGEPESAH